MIETKHFEADGIRYAINHGTTVTVESCHISSGEVNIRATVSYNGTNYSVTAIGDEAFANSLA